MGGFFHNRLVMARTDIPRRTDIDAPVPCRQNKHVLFGQQEGRCNECRSNGCRSVFPFRVSRSTTSSREAPAAKITSKTSSCYLLTATGSRETGRRSTWWPSCASWG